MYFLPLFSILFNFLFFNYSLSTFKNNSLPTARRRMPSLQFLESLLNLKNIQSEAIEDLGFSIISDNSFNSHFVDVQTNRSNVSNKLLSTDAKPNINYLTLNIEEEKRMELIDKNLERALTTKQLASKTEENLYKKLLNPQNYEKNVRPTKHHLLPTNITFGVLLNQIVEMDERNQILTTRCWINVNWINYRLSWNITQWEGINQIYAPHHRIWLPDIILINNAAHDYRGSLLSTDVSITNVGNVTWLLSALFKSNCAINVKYYPFDDQECTLKFASWGSHDSREIDIGLTTDQGDLSNYLNSTEFDLLSFKAERTTRRSTIRRISLLRDLKHIKNMENCKETRTDESKNCECMKENEEEKLPSSLNLKRRLTFADCSEDGCSPRIERRTNEYSNGRRLTQCTQESIGGECVTLEKMLMEQVMPRLNAVRPVMSAEFEERFRKILKRVYRSLQQFEIRDEVIDERKRIIWQWRTLASIIDRFLLFTFSFITFFTVTIFIIFPILFRERLLGQNEFIS
ncbi:hypothetical protein ACQ4LE_010978, partial [Meloidogyne hapla]